MVTFQIKWLNLANSIIVQYSLWPNVNKKKGCSAYRPITPCKEVLTNFLILFCQPLLQGIMQAFLSENDNDAQKMSLTPLKYMSVDKGVWICGQNFFRPTRRPYLCQITHSVIPHQNITTWLSYQSPQMNISRTTSKGVLENRSRHIDVNNTRNGRYINQ